MSYALGDVIMHQELSRREKVSLLKLVLTVLIAATVLITLNTILVNLRWNSSLTDLLIILAMSVLTFVYIKQNLISYKYCLIEDDFMIHEVLGSKEKRILNLNLHQIIGFAHIDKIDEQYELVHSAASKLKLYNCINTKNRHYMLYEEENEMKCITIQPSDHMIDLIKERIEG